MNFILGFVAGIVVSAIVCLIWPKKKGAEQSIGLNHESEVKKENLVKLENFISNQNKITNNDVQEFLNISDSTAERYLAKLEKEGKVRQVGGESKATYYEKI